MNCAVHHGPNNVADFGCLGLKSVCKSVKNLNQGEDFDPNFAPMTGSRRQIRYTPEISTVTRLHNSIRGGVSAEILGPTFMALVSGVLNGGSKLTTTCTAICAVRRQGTFFRFPLLLTFRYLFF